MNWLAQNWIWILLGLAVLVVLVVLGRGRFHGRGGLSHHGSGGAHYGGGGYSAATGPQGSGHGDQHSQHPEQPGLAIDPVTRQDVSTAAALTSIYQGRIYYFTSAESRQRFEASPAQYAREGLGHSLGPAQSTEPPPRRRRGGC